MVRAGLWISASLVAGLSCAPCPAQFVAHQLPSDPNGHSQVLAVKGGLLGGYSTSNMQPGIWPNVTASFVNLTPGGLPNGGEVRAIVGDRQYGSFAGNAAMWSGTPESYVNLQPAGASISRINAADGEHQVGNVGYPSFPNNMAAMWMGSAASVVSLHPPGATFSIANAISGSRQGGQYGIDQPAPQGDLSHAAMWSGTAASLVDMHPSAYLASSILGMSGDQQVGVVDSANAHHAGMWLNTPQSFVDMHPFPTGGSEMLGTSGSAQVGWVNSSSQGAGVKAGIWFGSPNRFINLAQFLPPGAGTSVAISVEERGGVFTVGGYARYGFQYQAFVWVGVPVPSSVLPLLASAPFAFRRRR